MTKLVLVACALLSSFGAINALEGEKINPQSTALDNGQKARVKGEKTGTLSGAGRKLQGGGYGAYGNAYGARGGGGGDPFGNGYVAPGYDYGYRNGNGNRNDSDSASKSMKKMKMSMKSSSGDSSGDDRRPIGGMDDYYFMGEYEYYDDAYMAGPDGDFLDYYGGPCVHVVEKIHFEFPPPTDIFAPNGGVFGDIGTTYIWALVAVKGFGTLDGVCTRTFPDFDGAGGDGLCHFVLTDPETGDQLLFGGKLDSITPGGALAVTGGSGSVSGVFGDIYIHVEVDGGNDVLDFSQDFFADGLLGVIHCPQKHGAYDPYEYQKYPYW
jgi:hypothetical protein